MRVTAVDDRCRLFFRLFFDDFEFDVVVFVRPDGFTGFVGLRDSKRLILKSQSPMYHCFD